MTFQSRVRDWSGTPYPGMKLPQALWAVNVATLTRLLSMLLAVFCYMEGVSFLCKQCERGNLSMMLCSFCQSNALSVWGKAMPFSLHSVVSFAFFLLTVYHVGDRILNREFLAQELQLELNPPCEVKRQPGMDILKFLPDMNAKVINPVEVDLPYVFEVNAGSPNAAVHVVTSFTSTPNGTTAMTHVPLKHLELERAALRMLIECAPDPSKVKSKTGTPVAEAFGPVGSVTMIQPTSGGCAPPLMCFWYPINAEKKWKLAGRAPTLNELNHHDAEGTYEWVLIFGTHKLEGKITENGQTYTTESGVINFICFHTLSRLQELDFTLFVINVDYDTTPRLWHPFSKKKKWPAFDECTWMSKYGEAERKKLLTRTKDNTICLPPERVHPLDIGCFELDADWSLLGKSYPLKTVKWKPAEDLKGLFVGPSVNNGTKSKTRSFGFDHMVRILADFATVGTACCVSTTQETGPGASSSLCWKKGGGNKFELGCMHHGGVHGMSGFRNRATPPQPLLSLLRKHITKAPVVPPYSKAFTAGFQQMSEDCAKLATLEECDADPMVLARYAEKNKLFSGVFNPEDESELTLTCGDMADYRLEAEGSKRHGKTTGHHRVTQKAFQRAVRMLAQKTNGKKTDRQLHCVLYNAMRDTIYDFDEQEFEDHIGSLDEDQINDYIHGNEWRDLNYSYYGEDYGADAVGETVGFSDHCAYSASTCENKQGKQRVIPSPFTVALTVNLHLDDPSHQIDYSQPPGCEDYPLDWFAAQDFLFEDDMSEDLSPFIGYTSTLGTSETVAEPFVDVQKANIAALNEEGHSNDKEIIRLKERIDSMLKEQEQATKERMQMMTELRIAKQRAQAYAFERLQAHQALEERKLDQKTLEERGGSPTDGIRPPGFSLAPPGIEGGAGFNGHATHEQVSLKVRQDLGLDSTMSRQEPVPLDVIHEAQEAELAEARIEGRPTVPVTASQLTTTSKKKKSKSKAAKAASPEGSPEPTEVHVNLGELSPVAETVSKKEAAPKKAAAPKPSGAREERTAARKNAHPVPTADLAAHCFMGPQHFADNEASMVTYPGERTEEMAQSLSFLRRFAGLKTRFGLSESVAPTPLRSVNPAGDSLQFEGNDPFGPQFDRELLIPFKNYSERVFKKSGTGYQNGLNAIPPASRQTRAQFNAAWKAFVSHEGGWENMSMRTFGLYLDAVVDTLDGHVRDSVVFQTLLGSQLEYKAYYNVANELPDYYNQPEFDAFEQADPLELPVDALSVDTQRIVGVAPEWIETRRSFMTNDGLWSSSSPEDRMPSGAARFPTHEPDQDGGSPTPVTSKFGGVDCRKERLDANGGLAFGTVKYVRNKQQKAWKHAEKCSGWFRKWSSFIWDSTTNRPTGAMAAAGPDVVRKSFSKQLAKKLHRVRAYSTTGHIEAFTDGYVPTLWEENITLKDYLARVHRGVIASKSTAFGQQSGHKTKAEFMQDPAMLISTVYGIFLTVATYHGVIEMSTPKSLFEAGLLFPEEIFGKDEIHMNKKVDEDTLRCIWNTSIQMEIRTRFFHDRQNKTEITAYGEGLTHSANFPTFGSASGMGHCDRGGAATRGAMRRLMSLAMFSEPQDSNYGVGVDASGWDISVSRTLLMADAWRRAELARQGGAPMGFCRGIQNMGLLLSAHIVVIGQTLIEPKWFGMVGSGSPSTTGMNGFCRQFAHSELFWTECNRIGVSLCMGDDCHSKDEIPEGFRALWQQLGVNIKDSFQTVQHGEEVDFTSHKYNVDGDYFYFDNACKLMLRLAYEADNVKEGKPPITREQAAGVQFAVRHNHVVAPLIREYVESVNPEYIVAPENLCAVDVDLAGFF